MAWFPHLRVECLFAYPVGEQVGFVPV